MGLVRLVLGVVGVVRGVVPVVIGVYGVVLGVVRFFVNMSIAQRVRLLVLARVMFHSITRLKGASSYCCARRMLVKT